jgi:hypothetical protein
MGRAPAARLIFAQFAPSSGLTHMRLASVRREGASSREAYLVVGRLRRLRILEPRSGSGGTRQRTEGVREASGPPPSLSADVDRSRRSHFTMIAWFKEL